jgi:hypothetical protein
MNAPAFLESLQARGVQLVPDASAPSGVRALAPPGVVTAKVAARIREALPLLLPLIADAPGVPPAEARVSPSGNVGKRSSGKDTEKIRTPESESARLASNPERPIPAPTRPNLALGVPVGEDVTENESAGALLAESSEITPEQRGHYWAALRTRALTGESIPDLEEWLNLSGQTRLEEIQHLGAEAEIELIENEAAQALSAALTYLESLDAPISWPKSKGCTVPDVSLWLRLAGERRNQYRKLYGVSWLLREPGASLWADLRDLREWLEQR